MCSLKFSPSDDQRLVNSVKDFPVLFNHERFFVIKNPDIIRENWRAVASEVGRDEEACRKRWRDIRDHYFKVKRKQQASQDHKWTTRWPLYKSLSFLANAKRKKSHPSDEDFSYPELPEVGAVDMYQPEMTFKVEEDSVEYVDVMASPRREADTSFRAPSDSGSAHWGPQAMVEAFAESRRRDEDDIDVFMKSVALTVKRLSPEARAEAKLKILSVVTDLEFPPETKSGEDTDKTKHCSTMC